MNKKLISLILTLAIALAMVLPTSADDEWDARWAKEYTLGTLYQSTLSTVYSNSLFSFKLKQDEEITVRITSENAETNYVMYSVTRGSRVSPSGYDAYIGTAYDNYIAWNKGSRQSRATVTYSYLTAGEYYFALRSSNNVGTDRGAFSVIIDKAETLSQSSSVVPPLPPVAQQPFTAGSVARNASAILSGGSIYVNWDAVNSAKYAVYVMYTDRNGEVYGDWTVGMSDYNSYVITRPVKNMMYHITILPYSDVPYRQYGGFSPYVRVLT